MLNLLHIKNTRPRIRTASPLLKACGNLWGSVPGCQLMVNVVDPDSVLHPMLAVAASSAAYSFILVAADDTLGLPVPPLDVALQLLVAASFYNALLMPVGLVLLRRRQATPMISASAA